MRTKKTIVLPSIPDGIDPVLQKFLSDFLKKIEEMNRDTFIDLSKIAIPSSVEENPIDGTIRYDEDEGRLYVYYGEAWHYATMT